MMTRQLIVNIIKNQKQYNTHTHTTKRQPGSDYTNFSLLKMRKQLVRETSGTLRISENILGYFGIIPFNIIFVS